jgi:hypothetical protein
VAYFTDEKSILATFKDGIRFLDAATGKLGNSFDEIDSQAVAIAVFPDLDFIAADQQKIVLHRVIFANARAGYVKSWMDGGAPGTITTTMIAADKKPFDVNAVPLAVDPAGACVIITGPIDADTGKNVLWAWPAGNWRSSGSRLAIGHDAIVVSAAWSKDGKTAVTGDASGRVIVWDAKTMKESNRLELGGRVAALALSPEGNHTAAVVVRKQAEFYAWETAKPKSRKMIHVDYSDFAGPIHACLAFSPDGRQLAGCAINMAWLSRLGELTGSIHTWELEEAKSEPKPGE